MLRWYQQEAVDAVWNHLCGQAGNPIVVVPTGGGKTHIIAQVCHDAINKFNGRVIVLAHRKELLQQSAAKLKAIGLAVGLYSAGLNQRDTMSDVVLAGIQSVYEKAVEFGERNLVIVDESHLVPSEGEGMYRTFFKDLAQTSPRFRVVGLTATPFRTGEGKVCRPDALFQKIAYSVPIKRLIQEGYLCRLTTPDTSFSVDTSGLHIRGGEFIPAEMIALFDDDRKIEVACIEIIQKTQDRHSLLVFCSGVFHAAKTAKKLEELTGEECGLVTGDTFPLERAATLERFKNGSLKRLVNIDVLTTGFDSPNIDALAILRSTNSPGLLAQMVGRGFRIDPSKSECLVLDFGENFKRLGPIDAEDFGHQKKRQGRGDSDAPQKTCPACAESCAVSLRVCSCGWKFPEPPIATHGTNPDGSPIFESDIPPTTWVVEEVHFARHKKKKGEPGDPDTLRVDYVVVPSEGGGNLTRQTISEWVCLEHENFARNKAAAWWKERSLAPLPDIDGAIDLWTRGAVASPTVLTTRPKGKFLRIVSYELDPKPEEWKDAEEIVDAFEDDEIPF